MILSNFCRHSAKRGGQIGVDGIGDPLRCAHFSGSLLPDANSDLHPYGSFKNGWVHH